MTARLSIVLASSLVLLSGGCGGQGADQQASGAGVRRSTHPVGGDVEPARHLHDKRPAHGGAVVVLGEMHVEIAATPDGHVRAFLSDDERRPIPAAGTSGTVSVNLPAGRRTVVLSPAGDVLEGRTAPFGVESAMATVSLTRDGQTLETSLLLDLTGERAGVTGVPAAGCVPPGRKAESGRSPRCTATFPSAFTALGATRDGVRVALALSHGSTSLWSLPAATIVMGLDPAPPVPIVVGQHEPDPRVLALAPDGTEIAVALGERIVVFDAATGRFARELRAPGGNVRSMAWLADGERLVVATAGASEARLLDAGDGRVLRTIASDGRAGVVAADAGGRVAVGTDAGTIVLVDAAGAAAPRVLAPSLQPVAAIAFAGDRLVSAGTDGTVRVFDSGGGETARVDIGTPLVRLAVAPDGRRAATADAQRVLRVHGLPGGEVVESLAWHQATVSVLGMGAGNTLVSGDNDGTLAVWDLETSPP
jgi:hypothetical protein